MQTVETQRLFDMICQLPPEKLPVVEDFIEFLRYRDERHPSVESFCKLSESAFQRVWDNPEDADYDNL